jgi:hypothetical protein
MPASKWADTRDKSIRNAKFNKDGKVSAINATNNLIPIRTMYGLRLTKRQQCRRKEEAYSRAFRGEGSRSFSKACRTDIKWPASSFWTKLPKLHKDSLKCSSKVSSRRTIWRLMFLVALLALLIGTTLGVVCHHHATSCPDACPICHLSHQAIEQASTSARVCALIAAGSAPEPRHHRSTVGPVVRHIPARAPPE